MLDVRNDNGESDLVNDDLDTVYLDCLTGESREGCGEGKHLAQNWYVDSEADKFPPEDKYSNCNNVRIIRQRIKRMIAILKKTSTTDCLEGGHEFRR